MSEQEAPITEAGRKLPDLSKAAQNRKHRYIIMDERGPESVLLGYKDYRGLVAATNLMQSPKALRHRDRVGATSDGRGTFLE